MAFFQFGSWPILKRKRRFLPRRICVRTCSTRTLNSSSTAALICVLVARSSPGTRRRCARGALVRALLGDQRPQDHLVRPQVEVRLAPACCSNRSLFFRRYFAGAVVVCMA